MADIIDNANDLADLHLTTSLKNHEAKKVDAAAQKFDGTHCVDCEEEVYPPARKQLGYIRCIDCETVRELRQRTGR